jgi:dipeptidyl-peptidase-4
LGDDPHTALWVFDLGSGSERLVADPTELVDDSGQELSLEERARRERTRETASGIVAYGVDRDARVAAFALSGRLFAADLAGGGARELDVPAPAFDPRPDPTGRHVAFIHDRALHTVDLGDGRVVRLAGEADEAVRWGTAEYIAAEEMHRTSGYWWSPDGEALLAVRTDETPVRRLWISDPANPVVAPRAVRYPTAGSPNALVEAYVVRVADAAAVQAIWDRDAYPYLAAAHWDEHGPMIVVQSRDQRRVLILAVDPASGETSELSSQTDDDWVDLVAGVPRRLSDGRLVTVGVSDDAVALMVGGTAVTPPEMEVREVLATAAEEVLFSASTDPIEVQVWRWDARSSALSCLTPSKGVHTAAAGGGATVVGSAGMEQDGTRWTLDGHVFGSRAERPGMTPCVTFTKVGSSDLRVALVLPRNHERDSPLPVLMDPYGGPHFQRVVAARSRWFETQWFADQGFAVVAADGRGTPGRGSRWARIVRGDLATPALEDQVTALHELAELHPYLDLTRVAIRGWSFGGYLAALAVLRRPDVFHAAVAGAPVTEWRLYDTHYTERYLGVDPDGADRPAYDSSSLLNDAATLSRPLLLIHGIADDNVLAAHTLKLSQRLTEAGRLHAVLPLTGVTHMTPQEAVAEHMLTVQVDFIRQALGLG